MKKLEKLLNKISKAIEYLRIEPELCITILFLIMMLTMEILGIFVAILAHNYLILSTFTYVWVWMITEACVKKIFFNKFNCYLLETPKTTTLTFWTLFVVAAVLSWKYFTAFIFAVILAFMYGDYNKTKKKEE